MSLAGTHAIAGDTLIHFIVVDLRIQHSLNTCLEAKLRIVDLSTWLDELGLFLLVLRATNIEAAYHANAYHIGGCCLSTHLDCF